MLNLYANSKGSGEPVEMCRFALFADVLYSLCRCLRQRARDLGPLISRTCSFDWSELKYKLSTPFKCDSNHFKSNFIHINQDKCVKAKGYSLYMVYRSLCGIQYSHVSIIVWLDSGEMNWKWL